MSIALELLGIAEQAAAYHGTSAAPETIAKEGVVDSLRIAGRCNGAIVISARCVHPDHIVVSVVKAKRWSSAGSPNTADPARDW